MSLHVGDGIIQNPFAVILFELPSSSAYHIKGHHMQPESQITQFSEDHYQIYADS